MNRHADALEWDGAQPIGNDVQQTIRDDKEAEARAAASVPPLDVERAAKALVAIDAYCCEGCVLDFAAAYAAETPESDR